MEEVQEYNAIVLASVVESENIENPTNEIFEEADFTVVNETSNKGFKTHSIDSVHHFSDEELKELAVNITELDKEIDAKDSEMEGYKIRASSFKKQIENLDSERRSKSRKYRDGFENRSYTCKREDDFTNGVAKYIDITTDELIKTESLDGIFSKEDDQY